MRNPLHAQRLSTLCLAVASLTAVVALPAQAQQSTQSTPSTAPNTMPGGMPAGSGPAVGSGSRPAGSANAAAGSVARADRKFIERAAVSGMAEVELGTLGQKQASNEQVKQFAARMVQDHGKANDQLMQLASSKGVTPPTTLDGGHKRAMERLSKLSGEQFDKQFMTQMVADHKKTVSEFQRAEKSAQDPALKSFASATLPTLQEHLQMAQSLAQTVGVGAMSRSGGGSGNGSMGSGSGGATGGASGTSGTGDTGVGTGSSAGGSTGGTGSMGAGGGSAR